MNEPIFQLGSLSVSVFSCIITFGALLYVTLTQCLCGKLSVKKEAAEFHSIFSILLGTFFAHFLYCLVRAGELLPDPEYGILSFFCLNRGGFMMYGLFVGILLSCLLTAKITGQKALSLIELSVIPLFALVAVIRFAEPFDGLSSIGYQGFGSEVAEEWLQFFPVAYLFEPEYEEWYFAVFFYEGVAAVAIAVISGFVKNGRKAITAMTLYAAAQIFFESIRCDEKLCWLSFLRVEQLFSAIVLLLILIYKTVKSESKKGFTARWIFFIILIGIIVFAEFFADKTYTVLGVFIQLPCVVCHAMVFACAAALCGIVLTADKKSK